MQIVLSYYYYGRGLDLNSTSGVLLIAAIGAMILGLIAQARVKSVFNKFSQVPAACRMTAAAVAENLLYSYGSDVRVQQTSGTLTDNFNPKTGAVNLSQSVYSSTSIAAIAVAAHECGHVMQYQEGYFGIRLRNAILPVANFGSRFSYVLVIVGLFLGSFGYYVSMVGVALFAFVFAFQLLTLPVELNASRRALDMLTSAGYIAGGEEESGAKKVLRAAAFTYVIAVFSSAITLLRLLTIVGSRRRR